MKRTAIVIGATGLVGTQLIEQLLNDETVDVLKIFVRRSIKNDHPKLREVITDFDHPEMVASDIIADVVFCCMGTTIKTAGSQEAFAKVDYTYVLNFASIAKKNGVPRFVLVSSLGVSLEGGNFYLTVKRDIENALEKLKFDSLIVLRPSMLLGNRNEFRLGESIGKVLMKGLGFIFIGKLKKYKAIEVRTVARAMIALSRTELEGLSVFESNRLQDLGK